MHVSGCVSVYNVCFQRFCELYQSACSSNNLLVQYVQFFILLLSPVTILLDTTCLVRVLYKIIVVFPVNLVRELRDNSLFVPGFLTSELNLFVHNVTTS